MIDIPKGCTIFCLRNGINIYSEPDKNTDRKVLRVALKTRTWEPDWVKGWIIGESTGELKTQGGVQFVEINVFQSDWTRKNFLAGWRMADSIGYMSVDAFSSDAYAFYKDGKPINFGETILGGPKSGTQKKEDEDMPDYSIYLWVLVFLLAMVAGYKALNRKRKN